MKLEYFGHSFWRVVTDKVKVVLDPFENIGYPMPEKLTADYVCVSHEHRDHNNVDLVHGKPVIIRTPGVYAYPDLTVNMLPVFHDDKNGTIRGRNNIIKLNTDNLTLVHCGDLGHVPDDETLKSIYRPDVLLVPVGEIFTFPLSEVWRLILLIEPKLIFPMHYRTSALGFKLGELDLFLSKAINIMHNPTNTIEIDPALLSEHRTIVMNWAAKA